MNRSVQQTLEGTPSILRDASRADPSARRAGLMSLGGILAALGTGACCVLPFALFALGIGGAWISNLTALYPYQPIFAAVTFGFLGYGFYLVYLKPKVACAEGPNCAKPSSGRAAKIGLWTATVLVFVALGFPKLAPLFL
ncbi:mercuric transporter MerT family protein [Bosea sp. (in: a-proteobacteria)]|uniref:mercuric transporter MerT family protein n=1 Tax=Bosea sp. (in: a-proteobacteria) TaxID=1871050 RepID=UPI00122A8742|nr:mercuric transporter MerT family protein [Bosea sp. (in: a-proteobacteria)]TAJ33930.1 MAG: mercury transporter MerT [Bosea sp. (in: a-proteobacteria)]